MDQRRIGSFISELRKEKNMTQKELAEKLGVTDRAVSKWENGRGMPEVSLMKPLCDILDITVNELLSGERIAQKDYQKTSEFRFLDTIQFADKKIRQKNTLFWVVAVFSVLLLLVTIALVYWLPLTQGYFQANEDVEIYYVHKTLPVMADGESLERFSLADFVEQDITERIDLEQLKALLPLMRVTVYKDDYNTMGFWQGDYIYEIFGHIKTGDKAGENFRIMIGDYGRNYLKPHSGHHGGIRVHTIMENETWLQLLQTLEGWNSEHRECFQWDDNVFSLYYEGNLYSGQGIFMPLPAQAQEIGWVSNISAEPDEELECSFGLQDAAVYCWQADGKTYLAVRIDQNTAYGIAANLS